MGNICGDCCARQAQESIEESELSELGPLHGDWKLQENGPTFDKFLSEVWGMSWLKRSVAKNLKPVTFYINLQAFLAPRQETSKIKNLLILGI